MTEYDYNCEEHNKGIYCMRKYMKRCFCLLLVICLAVFVSCGTADSESSADSSADETTKEELSSKVELSEEYSSVSECSEDISAEVPVSLNCSKEYVDEFMAILGEVKLDGLYGDITLDKEHCYNVTPTAVADVLDVKIFKFNNTCSSLILIDGEIYYVCGSFGGWGFVNAVPWDYDNDGNMDLLVASSWGSGLHRSEISVFNTSTKESTVILAVPDVDLIVKPSAASDADKAIEYMIYVVDITVNEGNLANMSYCITDTFGALCFKDGEFALTPYGDFEVYGYPSLNE